MKTTEVIFHLFHRILILKMPLLNGDQTLDKISLTKHV